MADYKPDCVLTCTADECTPIAEDSPQWNDFHMPCWVCTTDDHSKRHDLMWHEESEMYFHKLCVLERARLQAIAIADKDGASLKDCANLHLAGSLLRIHRRRLAMRKS